MKKKRKFLLSFILLTLGIFCFATTAHAKSQLVQLKAGKTYTLDVNGDGKKDKLKFIQKTIQRDYPQQTHAICMHKFISDTYHFFHSPATYQ